MISTLSRRLFLLLAILAGGFGLIAALPKAPKPPEPGVALTLPDFVDEWYGQNAAVTQRERDVLGPETEFARKQYTNGRGDAIFVSIVLSGEDMSASIHRPERCLPAQGFTLVDTHACKVPLDGKNLTVTRLHNLRLLYDSEGKPLMFRDGKQVTEFSLIYYWFIGSYETTASHTARYLMDARDRTLRGSNQRWAYVTVMSRISGRWDKFGRSEPQTDEMIQKFIRQLLPMIQKADVVVR